MFFPVIYGFSIIIAGFRSKNRIYRFQYGNTARQENFIKPGFPSVFGLTLIGLRSSLTCARWSVSDRHWLAPIIVLSFLYRLSIIVLSLFYHRSIIVLSLFYHCSIIVLSYFHHTSITLPALPTLLVPSFILHPGFGSYWFSKKNPVQKIGTIRDKSGQIETVPDSSGQIETAGLYAVACLHQARAKMTVRSKNETDLHADGCASAPKNVDLPGEFHLWHRVHCGTVRNEKKFLWILLKIKRSFANIHRKPIIQLEFDILESILLI